MSSYIIPIDVLDKIRRNGTLSDIKKLVKTVENQSRTEDNKYIIPNQIYYILMPNTVHQTFITENMWKRKVRSAVIKALRHGNWIDFNYYADLEAAKKELISRLTANIERHKMFIQRNMEAIQLAELRLA